MLLWLQILWAKTVILYFIFDRCCVIPLLYGIKYGSSWQKFIKKSGRKTCTATPICLWKIIQSSKQNYKQKQKTRNVSTSDDINGYVNETRIIFMSNLSNCSYSWFERWTGWQRRIIELSHWRRWIFHGRHHFLGSHFTRQRSDCVQHQLSVGLHENKLLQRLDFQSCDGVDLLRLRRWTELSWIKNCNRL